MNTDMGKRLAELKVREEEQIRRIGWVAHYVPDEKEGLINYHTHGLETTQDHLNFQIVLSVPMTDAHLITSHIIEKVKEGVKIEEGLDYVWPEFPLPLRFKKFRECGRDVLRLLIPDQNKNYPGEENCDPEFAAQLTVLEEE